MRAAVQVNVQSSRAGKRHPRAGISKHARTGPQRMPMTDRQIAMDEPANLAIWHTTMRSPWDKKRMSRAAGKRAKHARKESR